MNKIFKVIFNKTTGQFVVVSELSKAKGKASSSTDERVGVSSLVTKLQYQAKAALILGLLGVSSVAYAAQLTYGDNEGVGSPIAIGASSDASGEANIALGEKSSATDKSKTKKQMIAIGNNASVTGSQAIAIGGDTVASGFGSIAIGGDDMDGLNEYRELRYNPTSGKVETRKSNESAYQKTTASGVGSISIGPKSQSLQNGTIAVGVLATAAGTESVSIGVKSASKGANSVALGAGSTASAGNSVAIGNNAVAESDGGVALGKDSIANIASGLKGYDVLTNAETTETNSIWQATHAAVSIGKADGTITRQIKGVAAGSNDTDAVNVAQLKKVTLKVSGDSGSGSVALNSQTLNIDGQDGIVSEATGQKVIVKLDSTTKGKVDSIGTGEVAASNANTVTGGKVYTAIAGAKTTVSAAAGQDVITVTPTTSSTGITANSYTVGINTTKLADAVKTNTKGDITSTDLTVVNGTDRLLGTTDVTISLKDTDKQAIAAVAGKLNSSEFNETNVTNKVTKGNLTSTSLTVGGTGKVIGSNISVELNQDTKNTLAKVGTGAVAANNQNTVTGGNVYTAITGAKTIVEKAASETLLTVNKTAGTGTAADKYTLSLNKDALKTEVGNNFADKDLSNITATGQNAIKNLTKVAGSGSISVDTGTEGNAQKFTVKLSQNAENAIADVANKVSNTEFNTYKGTVTTELAKKVNQTDYANATGINVNKWKEQIDTNSVEVVEAQANSGITVSQPTDR
uniref:ESPR-type extended signal peptide-containing protein n=1 Tax=Glaesserella parasuis TaxID=738 RepID=UPI000A6F79AF